MSTHTKWARPLALLLIVSLLAAPGALTIAAGGPETEGAGRLAPVAGPFSNRRPQVDGGLLYMTSLDDGSTAFAVYDPGADSWTPLNGYDTTCQMAVDSSGNLYAVNYNTGDIDIYDPGADAWSYYMDGPPVATGAKCNLEVTLEGEFFMTNYADTNLYYTAGGSWNTYGLAFEGNAMGDYDPTSDQLVVGENQTVHAHMIDVHDFTVTDFTLGDGYNGEYARFSSVMNNQYFYQSDYDNIRSYDLSDPLFPGNDHGVSPGFYASSAADRANLLIYTAGLYGDLLYVYDSFDDSLTELTGYMSIGNHSSLAFVPGESVEEPDIRVDPEMLVESLCPDEQSTLDLYVCNDGSAPLDWTLTELAVTPPGGGTRLLPAGVDSQSAPLGYAPALTRSASGGGHPEAGTVCVFKNVNAWDSTSVEGILAANGIPYEVRTSAEFATLDFDLYGMIVFSSDQDQTFYDDYATHAAKFEDYVMDGGFLNFFAADDGWNGGQLLAPLPGGMTYAGDPSDTLNHVDDPAHPVMQGVPDPFSGSLASHGEFSNLPGDAQIIAHADGSGLPTTVEYPIGAGWFIAIAQTLEISYDLGWEGGPILPNTLLWGYEWGSGDDVPWLSEDPTAGTVAPGNCDTVLVTFDSTGLAPDAYFAELLIESNDPDEPQVTVPVELYVDTCAENTMHVEAIAGVPAGPRMMARVLVFDQDGEPLTGVLVDASIETPAFEWARWRYTKIGGWARFWLPLIGPGFHQICVEDLTLDDWTYVPGDNKITCMGWDY